MLSKATMLSALPLAQAMAEKNIAFAVLEGTPLSELSKCCYVQSPTSLLAENYENEQEYFKSSIEQMHQFTKGSIEEPTRHSILMDDFITVIARNASAHVSMFKNTVKPVIQEVITYVNDFLKST